MCNSAAKLYTEAERSFVLGDYERSYVLFGKYFKTILPLKKRDDYRKNKTELDAILGPQSKQLRAIDIMTTLRDDLVDRYDKFKTKSGVPDLSPPIMDQIKIPDQTQSEYGVNSSSKMPLTDAS